MQAKKTVALFVGNFLIALAAGFVGGRAVSQRTAAAPTPLSGSMLSTQLQLTPEQSEQMRPIWERARDSARACAAEAERVEQENDEQLKAILSDAQKGRYAALSEANHQRIAAQKDKRKDAFRGAIDATRAILRPDQWQIYEGIVKDQLGVMP